MESSETAFLTGKSIFLRKLVLKDANFNYLKWMHDVNITSGIYTGIYPTSLKELKNYIRSAAQNKNELAFAICWKRSRVHIGNIKIESFDMISRTCGLGIIIGEKKYWGRGVGEEACSMMIDYAFERLNFRKITLIVFSNNPAAFRLYSKLGFKKEGVLKRHIFRNGRYEDKIFMSLFNPRFQ